METKECVHCHRIGYRAFVPYGEREWVCARDDLCRRRVETRAAVADLTLTPKNL